MLKTVRALAPLVAPHRKKLALGLGALVLKDILGGAIGLVIRSGIDGLKTGYLLRQLLLFGLLLMTLSALKGFFQYWMRLLIIGISRDVEYDVRKRLFDHLVRLDLAFYGRSRTGDIMARATNDLNAVRMMLGPGIMYTADTTLSAIVLTSIMLWTDWRLTILALAPGPFVSFAVIAFGRRIYTSHQRIQALFSDISSRVQESLGGVRILRAYAQEQAELEEFEKLNREYIAGNVQLGILQGLFSPTLESLISLAFLIVLWVGGMRLLAGEMTVGSFLMFNIFMGMLSWPMVALGWVANLMQRGSASLDRLTQLLEEKPGIAAPAVVLHLPEPSAGEIEFDGVTLCHGSLRALDRVNLRIEPGMTIAVVGHTGSGKSSLVQLIPRLFDPSEGVVRMDGIDLRDLDPAELRRHIGFVPQETFLFSATLAENIAFGVEDAPREAIERAADIAGLTPDIAIFPEGLDTRVGERGITLSGGQKQRTALARAIVRNPRILILDDALSSVDTVTEEAILTGLSSVMKDRTTILISHRVSTVRGADRIYVLEKGMVAEQGSHSELLVQGGYYADLYQKQLLEEELEAI